MEGVRGEKRMSGNGHQGGETFVLFGGIMGKGNKEINTHLKHGIL